MKSGGEEGAVEIAHNDVAMNGGCCVRFDDFRLLFSRWVSTLIHAAAVASYPLLINLFT